MEKFITFVIGGFLGVLSWEMAYTVSGTFEPFDSSTGFLVTQVILSFAAFMFGSRRESLLPLFSSLADIWE